jgi:hypothetical protein
MTKRTVLASAAVAAALTAGLGPIAAGHDDHHGKAKRQLKADLRGFNEVPAVSSTGRGSFSAEISKDETSIEYRLRFWDLEGDASVAHIHLGDHHTSGGVSVWLCGTAALPGPVGTPLCDGGDVTGTLMAAQVIGPAGQGIAAAEFEELVRAIRAGVTYVNVHSTKHGGGEIRGEIRAH